MAAPELELGVSTIIEVTLGSDKIVDFGGPMIVAEIISQGPKGDPGVTAVENAINEGVTDKAPSEGAVFTALEGKLNGSGTVFVDTADPGGVDGDIWLKVS